MWGDPIEAPMRGAGVILTGSRNFFENPVEVRGEMNDFSEVAKGSWVGGPLFLVGDKFVYCLQKKITS